jgi:uncharacterized Zn finger protein
LAPRTQHSAVLDDENQRRAVAKFPLSEPRHAEFGGDPVEFGAQGLRQRNTAYVGGSASRGSALAGDANRIVARQRRRCLERAERLSAMRLECCVSVSPAPL